MGNTNIPQAGAIGTKNSRDTLAGGDQLTEDQKKERRDAQKHSVGPAPSRAANVPERISGQQRGSDDAEDVEGVAEDDGKRERDSDVERPANDDPYNPRNTTGAGDPEALGGHANTGHSPSDAT